MPAPRPETLFAEQEALKRIRPEEYPWTGDVFKRLEEEVLEQAPKRFPHTPEKRLYQYIRQGVARAVRKARHPGFFGSEGKR